MTYRPFRSISRFLLAACAVSLGTVSLSAQTTAPPPVETTLQAWMSSWGIRILAPMGS